MKLYTIVQKRELLQINCGDYEFKVFMSSILWPMPISPSDIGKICPQVEDVTWSSRRWWMRQSLSLKSHPLPICVALLALPVSINTCSMLAQFTVPSLPAPHIFLEMLQNEYRFPHSEILVIKKISFGGKIYIWYM